MSDVAAQRVLATVHGTTTQGGLGTVTRAAGDGDGVGDVVVSTPTNAEAGRSARRHQRRRTKRG